MDSSKQNKMNNTNWRTGAQAPAREAKPKSPMPSPTKKRGSLDEVFPGLNISRSTPSPKKLTSPFPKPGPSSSTPGKATFARLKGGFPNWLSFKRGADAGESPLNFTFSRKKGLEYYSRDEEVEAAFNDAFSMITEMRALIASDPAKFETRLDDAIKEEMCAAVFGSNFIERTGIPELEETRRICLEIFTGRRSVFEDVEPRSEEYEMALEAAIDAGKTTRPRRDRREVANHAAAMMYIINQIVQLNRPLSEDIIKETHRILCTKVELKNGDSATAWKDYAGVYRYSDDLHNVRAGTTNFVRPAKVAVCMTRFVDDINGMIRDAEIGKVLDPFYIAAHACGEFVNIHPFLDGNGRTCRLILNAILLKYTGMLAPIGGSEDARKEYLAIAVRRGQEEVGNGELAKLAASTTSRRLKDLMKKIKASPMK